MASPNQVAVAQLSAFKDRVHLYLADAAVDALNEELATPGTHSAAKVSGCKSIIRGRFSLDHIAMTVVTNDSLAATIGTKDATTANDDISDNDLSYVVKTEMFDAFAESL